MTDDFRALCLRVPYDRGSTVVSLFEAGEEWLGLEVLLENLVEFEVAVKETEADLLREACVAVNAPSEWIDGLVVSGTLPATSANG